MNPTLRRIRRFAARLCGINKRQAEERFWRIEMHNYVRWYRGEKSALPVLDLDNKVTLCETERGNAAMTFDILHQRPRYLKVLQLDPEVFRGKRVLDVGSGPHAAALCFTNCEVYGLDPLQGKYRQIGFPQREYDGRYNFVGSSAEQMPFRNGEIDVVISVNAFDHVDDPILAASEMRRVLCNDGLFRISVNYHSATIAEPHVLSDAIISSLFSWVPGLHKIAESPGEARPEIHESYALWSNF